MNRIVGWALVFLWIFGGCTGADVAVTIDGAAVGVDEMRYLVASSRSDVEAFTFFPINWESELEGMPVNEYIKQKALENAVVTRVVEKQAKKYGVDLSKDTLDELHRQMEMEIEQSGGEEEFDAMLAQRYMTRDIFFYYMRFAPRLGDDLFHELFREGGEQWPSDAEVLDYFYRNYVHASYILISTIDDTGESMTGQQLADRRALAEQTLQQLRDGADFIDKVREVGEDYTMSQKPEGLYFARGSMGDAFDEAAFTLEENEISDIVASTYGLTIIKRLPANPDYVQENFDQVRQDLCEGRYADLLKQWKEQAKVRTTKVFDAINPRELSL